MDQIHVQIQIPNKYLGCGYNGLVFVEKMVELNGKYGQGIHCTKMGANSSSKITQNAPEFICLNCQPKTKSSGFQWKKASLDVRSPYSTHNAVKYVFEANFLFFVIYLLNNLSLLRSQFILYAFDVDNLQFLTHTLPTVMW